MCILQRVSIWCFVSCSEKQKAERKSNEATLKVTFPKIKNIRYENIQAGFVYSGQDAQDMDLFVKIGVYSFT